MATPLQAPTQTMLFAGVVLAVMTPYALVLRIRSKTLIPFYAGIYFDAPSTIDPQQRSGDEACLVGSKEQRRTRYLFWRPPTDREP